VPNSRRNSACVPRRRAWRRDRAPRKARQEKNARPVQHGLRDFKTPNHSSGILAHQLVPDMRQFHEFEGLHNPAGALRSRHSVKLRGNQQIFVSGQNSVGRQHLRDVSNLAPHGLRMFRPGRTLRFSLCLHSAEGASSASDQRAFSSAFGPSNPKVAPAAQENVKWSTATSDTNRRVRERTSMAFAPGECSIALLSLPLGRDRCDSRSL